ncbi:MAG TPA: ubiquinone biosynthesis protein UbiB, partial [Hyphomonas sp.]|nr:ubiquinone biosynthesis protein UbiB [Hyphomonas sp.]
GAAKLVAGNVKEITNRLKRLPEVMDRFEASLLEPVSPPPLPRRFAPWWGWFGFIAVLVALGIWAAK